MTPEMNKYASMERGIRVFKVNGEVWKDRVFWLTATLPNNNFERKSNTLVSNACKRQAEKLLSYMELLSPLPECIDISSDLENHRHPFSVWGLERI